MSVLESRLKKIDETRNDLLEEINYNDLMNEKYEKTYKYLNYFESLLILVSTVTRSVSISAFDSWVCVPLGITYCANYCEITAETKKYKSIIKKKKKNMTKTCY